MRDDRRLNGGVTAFVSAGAGFLLAVLWFDLMHDVQVLQGNARYGDLPEAVLASIAGYYRRVTTDARPMNRLVATAMLGTLAAIAVQVARGDDPQWTGWAALGLTICAIALAGARTVPNAVRLGTRRDDVAAQTGLARAICRDHLVCLGLIAATLAIELGFAT
jgi:hypothetical protein